MLPQEGGSLTIFAPTGEKDEENAGLCVLAACEKYDILITGDLTAQAEYRLLSLHTLPQAAVLVAGHHGAATSTSGSAAARRPAGGRLHFRRGGQPLRPSRRADARAHPAVRRGRVPHRPVRHDHHQGVRTWQERHLTRTPGKRRRFKSDLKAGTLGNFISSAAKRPFCAAITWISSRKKIADGPAGEFNCHRFSADDCTPQALADAIDAMPMMAERTLVRVDDVDLFKQPEGAREQYAAIFSDLPDYCCVLFVYDTVEFKINGTMKKSSPPPSASTRRSSRSASSRSAICARGSRGISVPTTRWSRTICASTSFSAPTAS